MELSLDTNQFTVSPGDPGSLEIVSFGTPDALVAKATESNLFFWVHPSQCARLLDKIKLLYWTLDPDEEQDDSLTLEDDAQPDPGTDSQSHQRYRLQDLLLRLQARTKPFHDAEKKSPLVQFYDLHEAEFGAIGAVAQLKMLYQQASNYLTQLQLHQDLFGRNVNDVPLGSYSFYKNLLDPLIENFKALEVNGPFKSELHQGPTERKIPHRGYSSQEIYGGDG